MRRAVLPAAATAVAAAALALGGMAAAASPAYTFGSLVTTAGATTASFSGTGNGSGGDKLLMRVSVEHTGLTSDATTPADITGGTLSGTSLGRGRAENLEGTFIGGILAYNAELSSRAACGDRVYDLIGNLAMQSGTGVLSVRVTEKRLRLPGNRCISLTASAQGAPGLTLAEAAEY
jgi:hypothetical protein